MIFGVVLGVDSNVVVGVVDGVVGVVSVDACVVSGLVGVVFVLEPPLSVPVSEDKPLPCSLQYTLPLMHRQFASIIFITPGGQLHLTGSAANFPFITAKLTFISHVMAPTIKT